ncbi:hypothetical protein [Mucilaginibacter sp. OK098]|uniref:hypothetical protein n=1 Tax=Mucilaginibacter sp. OK098 TaxID=1855297 RepID=UPI00091F605F|nr:hypothetical protein [Mucilaginibacter sp. OK098]SHM92726.1 hypothetical protein SAMN05216524_104145 [Mucilaginibacter sp. OK098]
MKSIILLPLLILKWACSCFAQSVVQDQSIRYQQERMVYLQWDQKKFTPKAGFLSLNPYYWLTWGLFYPNYHKTDLRPLSVNGPQTQRLALVGAMNTTDNKYKLQSDTVRNTALSEIANQSGLVSDADPLWLLYYKGQLSPVLNNSAATILAGLSPQVSAKLVSEGLYSWYKNELDMLKQRVEAAHSTDMDRGARILAYHRYLLEYRRLSGVWAIRTASARSTLTMAAQQLRLKTNQVGVPDWTPQSDIAIANKVLQHVQ